MSASTDGTDDPATGSSKMSFGDSVFAACFIFLLVSFVWWFLTEGFNDWMMWLDGGY